jgi:putative ABC transport system permease protein
MSDLLFGVSPWDIGTFVSIAAILVLSAIAASAIPAIRAMRVDPMTALRYE